MNLHLFVDDEKALPESTDSDIWVLARTYNQAIELLKGIVFKTVSLDHDLGEEKTGYDIACWLEERQHENKPIPTHIYAHSENPAGRINIERAIQSINRRREASGENG